MIVKPITDAQIFYRPSKELVKFIKGLKVEDEVPKAVASIASKNKKHSDVENVKFDKKYTDYPSILNTSDIEYIKSLDLKEEVDFKIQNAKAMAERKDTDKLLAFDDLIWLHKYIEKRNEDIDENDRVYFYQLFQGTEIILPENEEVKRNPELEARCVKLRNQQRNREYKEMTKNVDNTRQHLPEDTISYQMKQINTQLIAVFQFVVSVLTGFVFGFLGIELMVGTLDFGFRLLLGIICALIVALAELYFLAKKLNEDVDQIYSPTTITSNHLNSKVKCE